jgi:hypothetical protein
MGYCFGFAEVRNYGETGMAKLISTNDAKMMEWQT